MTNEDKKLTIADLAKLQKLTGLSFSELADKETSQTAA